MPDLAIKLSSFEGPLDLLLQMIERDKINIYDIPIVSVTEQYIGYLRSMQEFDMEVASEFLVMAATLLQIKSRMLLPVSQTADEEEEADPRQMLVEMLLEYKKIKKCAVLLAELKIAADKFYVRSSTLDAYIQRSIFQYSAQDIFKALADLASAKKSETAFITPQAFSVQEKMSLILQRLVERQTGCALQDFFSAQGGKNEKVAVFLALLELLKMKAVIVSQEKPFAPIYIFTGEEAEHYAL